MPAAKVLRALFDSLVQCKEEGGFFQFVEVAKLYRSLPPSFTGKKVDEATTKLIKEIGMKASDKETSRIQLYILLLQHHMIAPQLEEFKTKWPIAHAKDEERGKSFLMIKERQGKQKQLGNNQDKVTVRVVVRQHSIFPTNREILQSIHCGKKENLDGLLWLLHRWWKKDNPQHDTLLVLNPYFYRASNIKPTPAAIYSTGELVWEPEPWGTVPAVTQSGVWVLYIDVGGSHLHIDYSKKSHLKFGNLCITGTDTYLVKEINGVVRSSDWLERGYGNSLSISGEQGRFDWKDVLKKWNPRVAGDIFVSPESVPGRASPTPHTPRQSTTASLSHTPLPDEIESSSAAATSAYNRLPDMTATAEGIFTSDSVLRRTGSTASSYHTAPGTPSRTSLVLKEPATKPEVSPAPAFDMVPSNSLTPARPSAAAPQPAMHKATRVATSPTPQPKKRGWVKWVKDLVGLKQ